MSFSHFNLCANVFATTDTIYHIINECVVCFETLRNPNNTKCRSCKDKLKLKLLYEHYSPEAGKNIYSKHEDYEEALREYAMNNMPVPRNQERLSFGYSTTTSAVTFEGCTTATTQSITRLTQTDTTCTY